MENKNTTFETLVKPVIVLAVICLVVSALLAVTNGITAPIIEANDLATTNAAYLEVLPEGATAEDLTAIEIPGTYDPKKEVISAVKTSTGAIAVKSAAVGFDGGIITTILGFDPDGNICGIWSDSTTQTAGMGSKCDDPAFKDQFNGLSGAAELTLNADVQQVAGCTVSSAAYVKAVNNAIRCYNEVKGA